MTVAEPPAPANLLAELSLGNPKETWQRVRLLGGARAQALPSSLPVLLTTSLSMPPSAASGLDETLPIVGALLSRSDASEPDVVLGMHVLSGPELAAALTLGDSAKFRRVELGPRLLRLLPAPGAPDFNGALGISGNYLLLATRLQALEAGGRFVAEAVAKRARNEPGVFLRAGDRVLAGLLAQRLRAAWSEQRASLAERARAERQVKGRPPDFAEPEVLLGGIDNIVESWFEVLQSSRELSISLLPEADRLRAELSLLPGPEGAAAALQRELVVGPVAPLFALPDSTSAALLLRASEGGAADAQGLGSSIARLFGERLRPEQAEKLVEAFDALGKSRQGATALGFSRSPAPGLLLTFELADPEAFPAALTEVVRLLELPPIRDWLTSTLGKPLLSLVPPLAGEARSARVRFLRSGRGAALALPSELHLSWQVRERVGYLAIAPGAPPVLSRAWASPPLAASQWLSPTRNRLADSALALFVDVGRLRSPSAESAPVVLNFGKQAERISASVELAPASLADLAGGFALER